MYTYRWLVPTKKSTTQADTKNSSAKGFLEKEAQFHELYKFS